MKKTFFVDPKEQGKGVGKALIYHIEELIKKEGYETSTLNSTITAKSFYEAQGYITIKKDFKVVQGAEMTKFHMYKKLG